MEKGQIRDALRVLVKTRFNKHCPLDFCAAVKFVRDWCRKSPHAKAKRYCDLGRAYNLIKPLFETPVLYEALLVLDRFPGSELKIIRYAPLAIIAPTGFKWRHCQCESHRINRLEFPKFMQGIEKI